MKKCSEGLTEPELAFCWPALIAVTPSLPFVIAFDGLSLNISSCVAGS